jgi:hypothetical protein
MSPTHNRIAVTKLKITPNSLIQFILRSKKTILLIISVSVITLTASTLISIWLSHNHNLRFPSLGTIRIIDLEAYGGDITTTQEGQYLDWGTIYPGTATNRSFYIKSISNVPIILNLTFANLTFQNSKEQEVTAPLPITNPMNLTWNYYNTVLYLNDTIYVTLTLETSYDPNFVNYVINNDVKKFNFEIIIKPIEQ